MNQQLLDPIPDRGDMNFGTIRIEAPVSGGAVQIGHGSRMDVFQLKFRGAKDATIILNEQDPLLQLLRQMLADGSMQAHELTSDGFNPSVVEPCLRAEDLGPDTPFASPFGIPSLLAKDAEQLARNFSSLDGFLQQLDQQFGGRLASLTDGQQRLNVGDLLLQKGNLALWRFRQGAMRLFAEQASLYALAEPQDPTQPALQAFQTAARTNLDVRRSWVLFQKYRTRQPDLIDQTTFVTLSQGRWQAALSRWNSEQRLASEQVQAEWSYLNAIGDRYNAQSVQTAAHEAEWYFTEALRRQPDQSVALVNLAALLSESALLVYIETGTADRARLQQARNLFQQAHALLDQRPDQEGQIALAQCLLYEAVSLPPDARLEVVHWAASQAQQLRAALGQNAPESVRWDIAQRNLARRDPSFVDRKKIEQARDILIGAAAMTILITLAEQWLSAHTQTVNFCQGGTGMAVGHHAQTSHPAHLVGSGVRPKSSPPSVHSTSHASSGMPKRGHSAVARVTGKGVAHRLRQTVLGTTIGKSITIIVILTVVTACVIRGVQIYRSASGITEFTVPTPSSTTIGIVTGPDGNLWFDESNGNKIGRITPTGTITEFPIPTPGSQPDDIVLGSDNNLWFVEYQADQIGRITPTGAITEFPIPTFNGNPNTMAAGPDGNIWFTEQNVDKIGRITPTGTITEFPVPTFNSTLCGMGAGPDGNIWFTEVDGNQIGRITLVGTITEFPIPTLGSQPRNIGAGPDGNLWFTESGGNQIGRITPTGAITEFPVPTPRSNLGAIVTGPDGNLWFTEIDGNKIGHITPTGTITEFYVPTFWSQPGGINVGPDGNLWFAEMNGNQIGHITPRK